jgi:hypothetical protein
MVTKKKFIVITIPADLPNPAGLNNLSMPSRGEEL